MKKKFGIIGSPIQHSLSPTLHNYWFKKYKINSEYSLLEIKEDEIKNVIEKIRNKIIHGVNVTLPYKQKVIALLDQHINDAKESGSVNTIYLNEEKKVVGENTDVYGLQAAYFKKIIDNNALKKKALIIGAGGVSPSVIVALTKSNISDITQLTELMTNVCFKNKFKDLILEWEALNEASKILILLLMLQFRPKKW